VSVELVLNGEPATLAARPDEMLLDALRRAGVHSVRASCRIGVCGSCTVLLDGEPVTACLLLAGLAAGRAITTVEGLGGDDPVQHAFTELHAYQCGWCTPGFVLATKRLLEDNPAPDDAEIAEALGGNLCRCGSYVKIAAAVRRCVDDRRRHG
jgi:aerobic-type carbon monoxide dehydrogenase small subunit (CoxS/CutS family)